MEDFDFDEWMELARRDPQGFEARRKALLSIEFARAGAVGTQARRLLEQFEAEAALRPEGERLPLAMRYVAASTAQLGEWMGRLQQALPAVEDAAGPALEAAPGFDPEASATAAGPAARSARATQPAWARR